MKIGGIQKCSLIDFPGHIATVLFTQGCPWRCSYCHNRSLVEPKHFSRTIAEGEVFAFLEKRKGQLDGVVVTGGEPTLHRDLPRFLKEIKSLGYALKLDTNGCHPQALRKVLDEHSIDYVAMDLKAPLERYKHTVRAPVDRSAVMTSVEIILNSGIEHEFRTTVVPGLHTGEDILAIARLIAGAERYFLQPYVDNTPMHPLPAGAVPFPWNQYPELRPEVLAHVGEFGIRGQVPAGTESN